METIIKLAKELTALRLEADVIKEQLAPIQLKRDEVQAKLMEAMKKTELKSIKTNTHNFSMTTKKDIKVYDEQAVIQDLDNRNLKNEYVSPKLNTILFKSMAKSLLKETGEIIDGTEMTETNYISIKSNK